jgi:hypothetical protein
MSKYDSFLAMILTNAKREAANSLVLSVDKDHASIQMTLPDGSVRRLSAPPPEIILCIIENLEKSCTIFESDVFLVTIETVDVQRGMDNVIAHISQWTIEHR